ncbi:LytR/AlgR family response regulator transcription factor [Pseudochryseolinea flava]|uniref:DNA-binding response regulator n=1 Tax=Pseudochryseolinea flava TaxID=2059302 RepID=A0A364Y4J9_9BACT|nr:LytTR family DNA-binding domain-containing protein [Pseudochryseolinea flava]RAW01706.1 DNA-binding response regulator [Pseudochryseolinea flava]
MTAKLNCIIIDDEPVARKGLQEYIEALEFLSLRGTGENTFKAAELLRIHSVDLMFLDIQMPHQSGLAFLKELSNPPITILTTAYSEHAVEGFSLDVIDYLVKPIPFERFKKACQKAYDFQQLRMKASSQPDSVESYFFVKCDGKFEKIFFHEVRYVEALQNYAVIYTAGRKFITYITLSGVEAKLPEKKFLKVHKSFIVGLEHVRAIEGNELIIESSRIPISRSLRDEVLHRIMGSHLFKR